MKNEAVRLMLSKQHLVPVEDITVEFIESYNDKYVFKAFVTNNDTSVSNGFPRKEVLKVTVKSEEWKDGF